MDLAPVLHLAAEFEFAVFAGAFIICIAILSLAAARFVIGAVLEHSFPGWRSMFSGRRAP